MKVELSKDPKRELKDLAIGDCFNFDCHDEGVLQNLFVRTDYTNRVGDVACCTLETGSLVFFPLTRIVVPRPGAKIVI